MQGIAYRFDSLHDLALVLESSADDQDIELPCREGVRDGEWLLVTFAIGDDATSVAGRVCDRGSGLRLAFEERDWQRLLRFARGEGTPSLLPPGQAHVPEAVCAPPGATALVVDPDPTVLCVVRALLEACGVITRTAEDADEALACIDREPFDLVVVEPVLSGTSGLELCKKLRADERFATTPVLVLSSQTTASDLHDALSAGADDFLVKPFRAPELRARALGLIHRARGLAMPASCRRC
ncbi:MAG: response regulator [Pseudomonadota bacterium]